MAKTSKAPVKPIGRILYSEIISYEYGKPPATYNRVCECKGYSDDRPFSVHFHKDPEDKKPWKVCYHWSNDNYKSKMVDIHGRQESRIDHDTYHMTEILQAHASKTAAQKAMREFATAAFEKVNDAATELGAAIHATCEQKKNRVLRIGDLVTYQVAREGTIYRVAGERRKDASWYTVLEPVFSFVHNHVPKTIEARGADVFNYVHPISIAELEDYSKKLQTFIIAMRPSEKRS